MLLPQHGVRGAVGVHLLAHKAEDGAHRPLVGEELKLLVVAVFVHAKRRVGANHMLDAKLLEGDAVDLRQPRVPVELEARHLCGRLEVDRLEPLAPDAPGRVKVDQAELVLLQEGDERVRRQRLREVRVGRLLLILVAVRRRDRLLGHGSVRRPLRIPRLHRAHRRRVPHDSLVRVEPPLEDVLADVVCRGARHVGDVHREELARHLVQRDVEVDSQRLVDKLVDDKVGGRGDCEIRRELKEEEGDQHNRAESGDDEAGRGGDDEVVRDVFEVVQHRSVALASHGPEVAVSADSA
mmetsp:Transcript_36789/g.117969  ORF Transcript_36789/g.117969 Transcript_36789/m.117969 type:complete len:295 (+) Transcript_36789:1722-2606(+)